MQGYVVGVAPKVAGVVTQVWVGNNSEVEADQPLFEVNPSQYRIALKKAESDLESARRQVEAGSAGVASARANLEAALANKVKAEKDYHRLKRLHEEDPGTISVRPPGGLPRLKGSGAGQGGVGGGGDPARHRAERR